MTKISIIIPVYNASKFLKKTIESISKQTLKDLEVICINDGSTDNSLDVLNDLSEKYDFITIINQKNQGPAKARNRGLEEVRGEYVSFLDADDIFVDEEALNEMYNFAKKNNLEVVSANFKFIEQDYTIKDNPHYAMGDYACFDEYDIIHPKDYGIPYGFTKTIFNNEFLKRTKIKFPNYQSGEDPIFLSKVFENITEMGVVPLTLYGYNHTIGGGVNAKINTYERKKDYIQHFKDVCYILNKCHLDNTSDFYKIHLFRYLTWDNNINDSEIFEIFNEIWGVDYDSFDETDFNYVRFIVNAKFYFINKIDSEEFFKKTYNDFLNLDIYGAFGITEEIFDKYFLVVYSSSYDEFKYNTEKFLNEDLNFKKEFTLFKINKILNNTSTSKTNNYETLTNIWTKITDSELFKIYNNIFHRYLNSFEDTIFKYDSFNINNKFYCITQFNSTKFFKKVNKEFLMINVYNISNVTEDILDKYFLVVYSYSNKDFKLNYKKYLNNNLKFKNDFLEFKIKKFIFNLDISNSEIVFRNTKNIILSNQIWQIEGISKELMKKSYQVLHSNSIIEYI